MNKIEIKLPSFLSLLTLLFIGLKLGGIITWNWFFVFSPLLFISILFLIILLIAFILLFFKDYED